MKEDERVLAVLVFGSRVRGRVHEKSDIDVCVVASSAEPWEVLKQVFSSVSTEEKGLRPSYV